MTARELNQLGPKASQPGISHKARLWPSWLVLGHSFFFLVDIGQVFCDVFDR